MQQSNNISGQSEVFICWFIFQFPREKNVLQPIDLHNAIMFCSLARPLGAASSIVNMRRITHPTVKQTLAGKAALPCVFTLQTNSSNQPPHLLWTRVGLPAGGQSTLREQIVLSAKG